MKKIVYTRPDGGITIIHPVRNTYPRLENLTDDQLVEKAKKAIPLDAIDPKIIDESEIPLDRTYRNAWEHKDGTIKHNMVKCRELHKEHMRRRRKPLLEKLDVDFIKALEIGDVDKQDEIKEKKQALRDVTIHPDIESATTPEQLKLVWPFEE